MNQPPLQAVNDLEEDRAQVFTKTLTGSNLPPSTYDGDGAVEEVKDRAHTIPCVCGGCRADRSGTRPHNGTGQRRCARAGSGFPGTWSVPRRPGRRQGQGQPKGPGSSSARQQAKADEVGARARWNDFGTPAMLTSTGDPLAAGLSADPVAAARYVAANRDLLGLTARGALGHSRS